MYAPLFGEPISHPITSYSSSVYTQQRVFLVEPERRSHTLTCSLFEATKHLQATMGTSKVAKAFVRASRGRCEARHGERPEDPPRAAARKRRARAQTLVGPAGSARYSATREARKVYVPGKRGGTARVSGDKSPRPRGGVAVRTPSTRAGVLYEDLHEEAWRYGVRAGEVAG
jgi:hypothetical protein